MLEKTNNFRLKHRIIVASINNFNEMSSAINKTMETLENFKYSNETLIIENCVCFYKNNECHIFISFENPKKSNNIILRENKLDQLMAEVRENANFADFSYSHITKDVFFQNYLLKLKEGFRLFVDEELKLPKLALPFQTVYSLTRI